MSDPELINEFELQDSSSDWSDEVPNKAQILIPDGEIVVEEDSEMSYSYSSEYDEDEINEDEKIKENDIIIHDEFLLPTVEEEKIEETEINLSDSVSEEVISFCVMRAQHAFKIHVPPTKSLKYVIDAISNALDIHHKYLCLSNITKFSKDDYSKSIKELGIQNDYILSLSFSFPVLFENKWHTIESPDCKDLNDFYVLLCQELDLQSLQLTINNKSIPTLQYPPTPLQSYFNRDARIAVQQDIIINIFYHNTELPYIYQEYNEIIKVKNNMKCVRLYKMVQDALNITYPILILYEDVPITPTSLTPDYCLINLKALNVYDLYVQIPEGISVKSYSISTDRTYGKEDIVTATLNIDTNDKNVLYKFVMQFTELTEGSGNDQMIISHQKCVLQSTQLYSQFNMSFSLADPLPACFVNRNYDFNHLQTHTVVHQQLKPQGRNHSREQNQPQRPQTQFQRRSQGIQNTVRKELSEMQDNSKRNQRSDRNTTRINMTSSRRRSNY